MPESTTLSLRPVLASELTANLNLPTGVSNIVAISKLALRQLKNTMSASIA